MLKEATLRNEGVVVRDIEDGEGGGAVGGGLMATYVGGGGATGATTGTGCVWGKISHFFKRSKNVTRRYFDLGPKYIFEVRKCYQIYIVNKTLFSLW